MQQQQQQTFKSKWFIEIDFFKVLFAGLTNSHFIINTTTIW